MVPAQIVRGMQQCGVAGGEQEGEGVKELKAGLTLQCTFQLLWQQNGEPSANDSVYPVSTRFSRHGEYCPAVTATTDTPPPPPPPTTQCIAVGDSQTCLVAYVCLIHLVSRGAQPDKTAHWYSMLPPEVQIGLQTQLVLDAGPDTWAHGCRTPLLQSPRHASIPQQWPLAALAAPSADGSVLILLEGR
jgi:hypothetical protein